MALQCRHVAEIRHQALPVYSPTVETCRDAAGVFGDAPLRQSFTSIFRRAGDRCEVSEPRGNP